MIPNRAIEFARRGGWEEGNWLTLFSTQAGLPYFIQCNIACDQKFWQALGKALGWPTEQEWNEDWREREKGWRDVAHRFYDLVLTGGDLDAYWNEILKV